MEHSSPHVLPAHGSAAGAFVGAGPGVGGGLVVAVGSFVAGALVGHLGLAFMPHEPSGWQYFMTEGATKGVCLCVGPEGSSPQSTRPLVAHTLPHAFATSRHMLLGCGVGACGLCACFFLVENTVGVVVGTRVSGTGHSLLAMHLFLCITGALCGHAHPGRHIFVHG